jgi:hypothetical protein
MSEEQYQSASAHVLTNCARWYAVALHVHLKFRSQQLTDMEWRRGRIVTVRLCLRWELDYQLLAVSWKPEETAYIERDEIV